MGMVEVLLPKQYVDNPISFIAEIEGLPVTPDGIAKVVINERNGTVVIGDKVKIAPVAVTHRNITVKVNTTPQVSQPAPLSGGETKTTETTKVSVTEESGRMIVLPEGTNIGAIVRALNAVGTTPQDVIAILVAIKEAGALYGVIEFI
jgi:flagellar P-ring protein precursor FlgI